MGPREGEGGTEDCGAELLEAQQGHGLAAVGSSGLQRSLSCPCRRQSCRPRDSQAHPDRPVPIPQRCLPLCPAPGVMPGGPHLHKGPLRLPLPGLQKWLRAQGPGCAEVWAPPPTPPPGHMSARVCQQLLINTQRRPHCTATRSLPTAGAAQCERRGRGHVPRTPAAPTPPGLPGGGW